MNLEKVQLYSAWHLNLNYSTLEVRDRGEVIEKCYWPLLSLAESTGCPQGVEISGSTLKSIAEIDSSWLVKLKELETAGLVELIASGYEQVVGPLAPARINHANISHGLQVMSDLLGITPSIYFLNEQCASIGVLDLAEEFGFRAAIMEWENAWIANPSWAQSIGWSPKRFRKASGIAIVWNHSRLFQALQRFVHQELQLASLLRIYGEAGVNENASLCFYGGDAEAFNFRAGRFATEASRGADEWKKVAEIINLTVDSGAHWIRPTECLSVEPELAINPFTFENQIQTKKQPKYNAVRWAASGRNDFILNNYAHKLVAARNLADTKPTAGEVESDLSIWASDLRTHITGTRWTALMEEFTGLGSMLSLPRIQSNVADAKTEPFQSNGISVLNNKRLRLDIETSRGLTVESAMCSCPRKARLLGRLPFGTVRGPQHSPDWYSGNFVHMPPARAQDSDIAFEATSMRLSPDGLAMQAQLSTANFLLQKSVSLAPDDVSYKTTFEFEWKCEPDGSLRAGFMTLLPNSWDWNSVIFSSHDGGFHENEWKITSDSFDMGLPVSHLVSATNLAGVTEGMFSVEDQYHKVEVILGPDSRGAALMLALDTGSSTVLRSCFSLQEYDDTFRTGRNRFLSFSYTTRVECKANQRKCGDVRLEQSTSLAEVGDGVDFEQPRDS